MRLKLGEQVIVIPAEIFAQALATGIPAFIRGDEPCKNGLQMAIKRSLKALMPMILEGSKSFFSSANVPQPDLKSKQARDNIIMYGLTYLAASATYVTDQADFIVEGVTNDRGEIVVTGMDAALPTVSATSELSGNGQPALTAPASPQES